MAVIGLARKLGQRNPRPLRILGDIAYVPLTRGMVAMIDAADAELVGQMTWSATSTGYARAAYQQEDKSTKMYLMHRLITGALPGQHVDHIDGDGLNNTRANLRICSRSENLINRGPQANNKTGFKGVSLCRQTGRYRAILTVSGEKFRAGRFDTPEQAARAYDELAKAKCGDFARLNFP